MYNICKKQKVDTFAYYGKQKDATFVEKILMLHDQQ